MDSITQLTLGAAVTEATVGKKIGNRAILWGAFLGTLPDLDVLFYPFFDDVGRMYWHRGISHSLVFMILAAPLLGWLIHKVHQEVPFRLATLAAFLALSTHVLIDCFTVYGTQVFEPFSHYRVAFNNLFIIDPLYTIPLLIGLAVAWFFKADHLWRARANQIGIALSCLYVLFSFGAKGITTQNFQAELQRQNIQVDEMMTAPTPFNTVLWRGLVRSGDDFLIGYSSLFDSEGPITFERFPAQQELIRPFEPSREATGIQWFSRGFYAIRPDNDAVILSDLRFGEVRTRSYENAIDASIFRWRLSREGDRVSIERARPPGLDLRDALGKIWQRMWGDRSAF